MVFGKRYHVKSTSEGYRKTGIASWYGPKFHGRRTSSGNTYNMYQLTAAHKSLPIPTYVRVTRVDDGRSLVVKVNDRGPFVHDRIIDLSYAAAAKLGIVKSGTAEVTVEAIPPYQYLARHQPPAPAADTRIARRAAPAARAVAVTEPPQRLPQQAVNRLATAVAASDRPLTFLQVGAFSQPGRALALQQRLRLALARPVQVVVSDDNALHRVKIGPLRDADDAAQLKLALAELGIEQTQPVSN